MKNDLTLLLLTHNRPAFLQRSLVYYSGLNANLIVLDSSPESADALASAYPNIVYHHCPEIGYSDFQKKLRMGLSLVKTPYMVFLADDDFVLHTALQESVEFLQAHPDYGVCHGYCLMYLPESQKVHYFLRDRKVVEDFSNESLGDRIETFMANYIPPWYAVTCTDLLNDWYEKLPGDIGFEYQEFGHAFYMLARAKAKILNRPYVIRELNYPVSDHSTDLLAALGWNSGEKGEEKRRFTDFLRNILIEVGCSLSHARSVVDESFKRLAYCLANQHSLTVKEIFHSEWSVFSEAPAWRFQPEQFVEMPFYNKPFFRALEVLDLLIRVYPAGKLQLSQMTTALAEQEALLVECCGKEGGALSRLKPRLDAAFQSNPFSLEITRLLLRIAAEPALSAWGTLLEQASQVCQKFVSLDSSDSLLGVPQGTRVDGLKEALAQRLPTAAQARLIKKHLEEQGGCPRIAIYLLDLNGNSSGVMSTIASLGNDGNSFAKFSVFVLAAADHVEIPEGDNFQFFPVTAANYVAQINEISRTTDFDWLMLVDAGEEFTPSGLMMIALELLAGADCRAVYGDELQRMADGTQGVAFRPGFNLDMLLSFPAGMARHWLFRRDVFIEAGGFDLGFTGALEFELLLRLIELGGIAGLGHISEPLLITAAPALVDNQDEQAALRGHLQRRGYADAQLLPSLPGRYRICYGHPQQPLVSIIVPTKDQLPILQRCVESLLEKTAYSNYELLIVDNASETPEAKAWLEGVEQMGEDKVRVLRYPHPFNYSAINNMAAREARGEYLVLLNNDTAVISDSWLNELLNHAQRPEVGIVGAKLLYPDGRIQHAGVILGLRGPAEHPFIGAEMDAPGYMNRLQVDQNYSAVTAACLMIRKSIYDEVGGLDEEAFKVSYNDIDLCLKVGQLGYLTVWTPHAVVMHEGSVSQKQVDPASLEAKRKRFLAEQDAMYEKWLPQLAHDPAYNENLALHGPSFALETNSNLTWRPLVWRPCPVILAHNADPWGCGNYRIIKPHQAMKEAGLIDGAVSDRLLEPAELHRLAPDVVVFQRQTTPMGLENMARTRRFSSAFKIYELDDYLPNTPLKSAHRSALAKDVVKSLRKGLGYVDRFVVSTPALADALADFHPDIRVIENRLPLDWWGNLQLSRNQGKPRVGWAGGVGHQGDLELIVDVVRDLVDEVEWVFFGMCPEQLKPYVKEFHPGTDIAAYPQKLASLQLDLALAPLEDNLFNACKSNLRILEYGICGFPVIASDIEPYRGDFPVTLVKNRYRDWIEAIREHLADRQALHLAGDALQAKVRTDWMLEGENLQRWRQAWLPD